MVIGMTIQYPRRFFFFLAMTGILALCYAYFSQYFLGYEPCPLCIVGRFMMMIATFGLLLKTAFPFTRALSWGLIMIFLVGCGVSFYHLWIQVYPMESLSCGPGLQYWIDTLTVTETLEKLFSGHGECSNNAWNLFGIPGPGLTLLWYIAVMVAWIVKRHEPWTPGPHTHYDNPF